MKKPLTLYLSLILMLFSFQAFSVPKLSSYPSSNYVVFLDFDGHYVVSSVWNGGNPLACSAAPMTDLEITEVFNRVSEDFRPFNVNVTTDSTKYLSAPITQRIRIIVTPTSSWYPGVGGISYLGSFTWGDDTPGFAFTDKLPVGGPIIPKMVAECCSHETGHTLNLSHQSKFATGDCINPLEYYNTGVGAGEIAWAPVMGNSYYRNMTGWNDGPTQYGCTSTQDNLSLITTSNGFTYRVDDYTETLNASTYALNFTNLNVSAVISTTTDKDAFRIVFAQSANLHLNINPFSVAANSAGANLDVKVTLFNTAGTLIRTYDNAAAMSVSIDTALSAGTYYMKVDGGGNSNTSEYGSLGSYSITGFTGLLPIHDVSLKGNNDKNKHNLNWNIVADEPIKNIVLEVATDVNNFKPLLTVDASAKNFSYQPYNSNTLLYRLKVTSVLNQVVYSNTVALRASGKAEKAFNVSTLVQNDITVNASANYQYRLSDMNGKIINSGSASKGINKINISNQPGGLYILSFFSNNEIQTERIVKQ
ncbi:MAG: T9SS type A sorting domain-containing protein [Chitinophagaceae bacterium]